MSSIEWTDTTWNPVRGCSRVSSGCTNCYAERMAGRFSGPGQPFEGFARRAIGGARWTGNVELVVDKLEEPLHWREPRRVFVNSMSDLFHEALPDEAIASVFAVMAMAREHTFQVLTKRPERMREWFARMAAKPGMVPHAEIRGATLALVRNWAPREQPKAVLSGMARHEKTGVFPTWPLPNVWLGVSAEDQETADERIPILLDTPAAIRFVSAEPLLGPIKFELVPTFNRITHENREAIRRFWVIVGGESGVGARPCVVDWVHSIVNQCGFAGVPCFVKQLGAKAVTRLGGGVGTRFAFKHPKGGDLNEWPFVLRMRQFPAIAEASA